MNANQTPAQLLAELTAALQTSNTVMTAELTALAARRLAGKVRNVPHVVFVEGLFIEYNGTATRAVTAETATRLNSRTAQARAEITFNGSNTQGEAMTLEHALTWQVEHNNNLLASFAEANG